jgi:hypothetical protein
MFKKNFIFAHVQNPTLTSERHGRTARILIGQPKQDKADSQEKTIRQDSAAQPRARDEKP